MDRILFIEPFFGGSHRSFAEGIARHCHAEVDLLTLPGRYWKWRMRGAAPILAEAARRRPRPDLIVASSMLALAEFLGHSRGTLDNVPIVLYFHENQLTYPLPAGERRDLHYPIIQLSSVLCADRLIFNTAYHLDEFSGAVPELLASLPDHKPRTVLDRLRTRSHVIPPGMDWNKVSAGARRPKHDNRTKTILWNHRWEHDKGPDRLLDTVRHLRRSKIPFRLAVTGAGKHEREDVFRQLPEVAGDHLAHIGYLDRREGYEALLATADIVLSTARHEFFGISVIEAIGAGAFPLLPKALSYPEILPPETFPGCFYESSKERNTMLEQLLVEPVFDSTTALRERVRQYDWGEVAPAFDRIFSEVISEGTRR